MGARSRSSAAYIRRQKAQIRRESNNPEAAIEALLRQFPRPTRATRTPTAPATGARPTD